MADHHEKKTARMTLWFTESMEIELMRRAAADDRKLSEYIAHVLSLHLYGQVRTSAENNNVANSREEDL